MVYRPCRTHIKLKNIDRTLLLFFHCSAIPLQYLVARCHLFSNPATDGSASSKKLKRHSQTNSKHVACVSLREIFVGMYGRYFWVPQEVSMEPQKGEVLYLVCPSSPEK